MVLLVTDVFLLLTQVLLWILVGLAARFILFKALPKAFLGSLVLALLVIVSALTFFRGRPEPGLLGDIWQIIAVLFNPLGLILVFLLIVWRDVENKGVTTTSKWLLRISVVSLLVLSLPLVSNFLVQRSEFEAIQIAQPTTPILPAGARRVIVLMGQDTTRLQLRPRALPPPSATAQRGDQNSLFQSPEPIREGTFDLLANQVQLTDKGSRILYAAQLFNEERSRGSNPLIVVTAGQRPGRPRKEGETEATASEAADITRLLITRLGVPGQEILTDSSSSTVRSSAEDVRKILGQNQVNFGGQLMIVTSALEMSRTSLTFQNDFSTAGQPIAVIPRPTDFATIPPKESLQARAQGRDLVERSLRVTDFLPSAEAFQISSQVLSESLTSLYYFLRGWLRPLRP
jgi:hypothetical protein